MLYQYHMLVSLKSGNAVFSRYIKGNTPEQTADMLEEDIITVKKYESAESMA